jgi:dihydropteroate synthase
VTEGGRVTALALHVPEAVRAALVGRGMEPIRAEAAAQGLQPVALLVTVADGERESLVATALKAGLDALSGDGWVVLAGPAARLAGLTRPGAASPPEMANVLGDVGRALSVLAAPATQWTIGGDRTLDLSRPCLIGVINATPDSFSDGGQFLAPDQAVRHGARLKMDGADLLDVGGESTRPGAQAVPAAEERRRVVPLVERLVREGLGPVSIDTRKADVARAALEAGAAVVNDVSALAHDAAMVEVVRAAGAGLILMHMRGTPETMDKETQYRHVAADVATELERRLAVAVAHGIPEDRIVLDPGFGFAKTPEQNYRLLDELGSVVALGRPVLIGPSRKRFLAALLPANPPPEARDLATAVACAIGWARGARLFRVHDVARARVALAVAAA